MCGGYVSSFPPRSVCNDPGGERTIFLMAYSTLAGRRRRPQSRPSVCRATITSRSLPQSAQLGQAMMPRTHSSVRPPCVESRSTNAKRQPLKNGSFLILLHAFCRVRACLDMSRLDRCLPNDRITSFMLQSPQFTLAGEPDGWRSYAARVWHAVRVCEMLLSPVDCESASMNVAMSQPRSVIYALRSTIVSLLGHPPSLAPEDWRIGGNSR